MPSGLEVLGAAAAVAQLTQLVVGLSKNAIEVSRSIHGTTDEIQSLYVTTREFQRYYEAVSNRHQSLVGSKDRMEQVIVETMGAMQNTDVAVLKLIDDTRAKDSKRRGKVLTAAMKIMYHRSDIERLGSKLVNLRRQLEEQSVQLIR